MQHLQLMCKGHSSWPNVTVIFPCKSSREWVNCVDKYEFVCVYVCVCMCVCVRLYVQMSNQGNLYYPGDNLFYSQQ